MKLYVLERKEYDYDEVVRLAILAGVELNPFSYYN